jgi:hypothetical protein
MLKKDLFRTINRNRYQKLTAGLIIVVIAGLGIYLLAGSHAATPYAAVTADSGTQASGATKVTSCTGASDGNCVTFGSASNPSCTTIVNSASSLTSAVNAAANGATVCVASGSYGAMTWNGSSRTLNQPKAIVMPAPGATVIFTGQLTITGAEIEVRNISLAGQEFEILAPAKYVQMTNITAGHFVIEANGNVGTDHITIKGGSIGPWHSYPDNWIVSGGGSQPNTNIMLDGVNIHDIDILRNAPPPPPQGTGCISSTPADVGCGTHIECLQIWAVDGLTIQNSTFTNCSVFDIFLQSAGAGQPPAPTHVLIQNNFLDCCTYTDTGYDPNLAIEMATDHGEGAWNNITIQNNTADDGFGVGTAGDPVTFSNVFIENNIAPNFGFSLAKGSTTAGTTVDYNLWYAGSKTGAHDLPNATTASLFIDFAGRNFRLKAGAPAIDKGNPNPASYPLVYPVDPNNPTATQYPTTDIDGNTRPQGAGPDIGADEYTGS